MMYQPPDQKSQSDSALDQLIRKYADTFAYGIAYVLAQRGETDRAFEWLGKAVEQREAQVWPPSSFDVTVPK